MSHARTLTPSQDENAADTIAAYMPTSLAEEIRRRARQDQRTVSSWVRIQLEQIVDPDGTQE